MKSISEKTIVDPFLHFGHEKKQGGNWFEITSAISHSKKIRFTYKSVTTGRVSDREVDPYLVVFYRDRWNMIGFSQNYVSPAFHVKIRSYSSDLCKTPPDRDPHPGHSHFLSRRICTSI